MESKVELKVFTLPTCTACSVAKAIAKEVADELGILFREVNMATEEGLKEGSTCRILSAPSIVLGNEVIVRGRLIPKERLREEVVRRTAKVVLKRTE